VEFLPYSLPNNIPDSIKGLPAGAKKIWVAVFNSVLSGGGSEDNARKAAWSKVKDKYKKQGDKWVKKKYTNIKKLPVKVQTLPETTQNVWMALYNQNRTNGLTNKQASEKAWNSVKEKFEWNSDKETWNVKKSMENFIMKEFLNKTKDKGLFKVFIPFDQENGMAKILEKEVDGKVKKFLHGIASNTTVDREDERISKQFIKKMQQTALGLTVFSEHEHKIEKTIGYIDDTGGDEDNFEILTALEPEFEPENNPTGNEVVTNILNKLDHGIKLGYSVGGKVTKAHKVFDEKAQRDVRELVDGDVYEVSVTAMPSAYGTWVTPIIKSMNEFIDEDVEVDEIEEEVEEEASEKPTLEKDFVLSWAITNGKDTEAVKKAIEQKRNELGLTVPQMELITTKHLSGELTEENFEKLLTAFQTINTLDDEGVDTKKLSKALDEIIQQDNISGQLYDLFWAFRQAVHKIVYNDNLEPTEKKTKINSLSSEFGDKVESLSTQLAELAATLDEQLA